MRLAAVLRAAGRLCYRLADRASPDELCRALDRAYTPSEIMRHFRVEPAPESKRLAAEIEKYNARSQGKVTHLTPFQRKARTLR